MTTISTSTAPAPTRQLGDWVKFGAIILTTFVVCWAIMYGATNGRTDFCPNCAPTVRKVDFSDGWDPL